MMGACAACAVRSAIQPADRVLQLILLYSGATSIPFEGVLYRQKDAVCIGSRIALILCDLYLLKYDRNIKSGLVNEPVKTIFSYVDDFFVVHDLDEPFLESALRKRVLAVFGEGSTGLAFTSE